MAREYAQIKLAIWADDDWRDLSPMARYLYLTLLTSPTLSHCGVADWRPARIAALCGMTPDEVEEYGGELVAALYLVIDDESEEVLIRSFVRNDGLMKQPKMAVAMASAHAAVASQTIRGIIVHELKRLREDFPTLNGWGSERATELLGLRSVDPSSYPLGKGKATPFGKGSIKGCPTPAPTPTPTTGSLTTSAIVLADAAIRDDVERICNHLADRIAEDGSKRPPIGKGWHDAARLMLDKDGRTEAEVHAAIDWCQNHHFWRSNILSLPKLREKYDQLRKVAESEQHRPTSRNDDFRAMQERQMARAIEAERKMGLR
jgi:hypothetical protein